MRHIYLFFILLILIVVNNDAESQTFSRFKGKPFIKNYTPEVYNAHGQNFDIAQDDNGIMYFANFAGILAYDGSEWNKTETLSGFRVLSLDIDKNGNVYAGGLSDFGEIKYNKDGTSGFISFADSLKEDVGIIFKVLCNDPEIYFISEKGMYIFENDKIKFVKFNTKAKNAFLYSPYEKQKDLYIFFERNLTNEQLLQNGLTVFRDNKFIKIKDNSAAQIVDIKSVFSVNKGKSLILGTASQGMFILRNNIITDFNAPVNELMKKYGHTCGTEISDSTYALGTLTHGILIVDAKGRLIQNIDKNSYLQDESINALFLDKNNSLWAAENNGISKIEVNWNLSYIDNKNSGLEGKVFDIAEFKDVLYFATDKGLYYLQGSEIFKVPGINLSCKDIEIVGDNMIAAGVEGLFTIKDKKAIPSGYDDFAYCITKSFKKNIFYTGYTGKVKKFLFRNNKFNEVGNIKTPEGDILKIEESKDGIYIEISPGRIFYYSDDNSEGIEIKPRVKFTALHLNKKEDDVFISYEKGLLKFENNKIIPFYLFPDDTSSCKLWIYDFYKIKNDFYVITDGEQKNISLCYMENGSYKITQTPFFPVANFSVNTIYYAPKTSVLWLGGNDGLILFNTKNNKKNKTTKVTIIRRVLNISSDTLLKLKNTEPVKLRYSDNSLRFYFAAPVFVSKGDAYFRYFLKGFDRDTSEWVKIFHKDYTNLPSGKYTFTVEAKNEFGQKLKPAKFSFEISTPVYLRWWAFIIYAGLLYLIVRTYLNRRIKAVEKERVVLENTVKERTEEIEQSKEEIESQRDELYKQKQEIVDSINYAKRIQQAVLPSEEFMSSVLKEYFVFFQPRDIVSGDFYWVKKIRNFSFVVAADCTGHGVPGAFMSMLGSSFLNEIVSSRTLDGAGEILNRLRNKVKKSLHQKGAEGEQKDGMDISLLIIDWDEYELQFAGAYNSVYIVRKKDAESNTEDNFEIIRLKADRQPIGIYLNERSFTNHSFSLKKGDVIYALSDGYVDQFGGDTGGKFKSGRFKKMLLSFQDKSMEEQKQILIRTFAKWKRDFDQVDDVLVMGIKIP